MGQIVTSATEVHVDDGFKWDHNFIKFVTGQCLSFTGKGLMRFVLPLYVLITTGNTALMGTILAVSAIPSILIAPISGVVVDRVKKNRLLAMVNIITALGIGLFWFLYQWVGIVVAVIFVMLILLTADSLTALTGKSGVSAVSPPGALVKANSILFLGISGCAMLKPIVGGFTLSRLGMNGVLIMSMAILLFATTINFLTDIPCCAKAADTNLIDTAKKDMKAGFRFTFKEEPTIGRVIILVNMLFCITLWPLTSITLPIVLTGYFNQTEEIVGILSAVVGFGGVLGTILIGRLGEKVSISMMRPLLFIASLIILPLGLALTFNASSSITLALLILTIFATFIVNSFLIIIGRAYFGRKTPPDMIGKVMGINSTFVLIGVAIGGYLYGLLFDRFPMDPGIVFLVLTVAGFFVASQAKIYK